MQDHSKVNASMLHLVLQLRGGGVVKSKLTAEGVEQVLAYGAHAVSNSLPVEVVAQLISNNANNFISLFSVADQERSTSLALELRAYIAIHSSEVAEAFLNAWKQKKGLEIEADIGILSSIFKFTII